jgi:hypothetical protein
MGKTQTQLRQQVVKELYHLPLLTGTADGSGSTTSKLIDTPILGKYGDDFFVGAHLYLTDSALDTDEYVITDSTQSTSAVNFRPTASAVPDSKAYEILPFPATAIHQAIDIALEELYTTDKIGRSTGLTLFRDSPIYNATFDEWSTSSALNGWTVAGMTVAQRPLGYGTTGAVTNPLVHGSGVLGFASSSTGTVTLNAEYGRYLYDMRGHTMTLYALVYSETANAVRIQLMYDQDGSKVSSTWHSGGGEWEVLEVSRTLTAGASATLPRIDVASAGATDLVAAIWFEGGPVMNQYPLPIAAMPNGPDAVFTVPHEHSSTGGMRTRMTGETAVGGWRIDKYTSMEEAITGTAVTTHHGVLTLERRPKHGRLWLPYKAKLTVPSDDTKEVALDDQHFLLVTKTAAMALLARNPHMLVRTEMLTRRNELITEIETLRSGALGAERFSATLARTW